MRRDGQGNLLFEKMGFGLDKERAEVLMHALNPTETGIRDTSDSEIWKRRRAAHAMVDAGLDAAEASLVDSDRIPIETRVGNFLEVGAYGTGTLVIREDEISHVQEQLGQGLDYDSLRGWHSEGDMTAKAKDLSQEIDGLSPGEQTADATS